MHKASSATMGKILEVPRSIHPRIHIEVPVWNHFRKLRLPLQYKELEFQRSFHPKNWCSKLQMPKGIFRFKAGFLKLQDPSTPDLILKLQCQKLVNCIIYHNTRNWSSRDPSTPKTDLQSSRCPKASSTSKQGFWSSRILPPQTWYWSILARARNWMFQRSFHFKIWNWKLQMPEASSASI